jgi:hypothetical protein
MDRTRLARAIASVSTLSGQFTLRSGRTATTYFDKYRFEGDPKLLHAIGEHLEPLVPPDTEVLAGLELGGVPLATALSLRTGLPAVFVRKKAKEYGTRQLAEGGAVSGRRLLVVEDVDIRRASSRICRGPPRAWRCGDARALCHRSRRRRCGRASRRRDRAATAVHEIRSRGRSARELVDDARAPRLRGLDGMGYRTPSAQGRIQSAERAVPTRFDTIESYELLSARHERTPGTH